MSLSLDARQRAMLQEMGVHVWSPRPAAAPLPDANTAAPPANAARTPHSTPPAPPAPQQAAPTARPTVPRAAPPAHTGAPVAAAPVTAAPGAPLAWVLQAPQPAYPHAPAPDAHTEAGPCWLWVLEGVAGADPLAGDAGRLLDNMLRALRLHQQPRVFLCVLAPLAADAPDAVPAPPAPAPYAQALAQAIAEVQPAVLVLMGRTAARAVLGRSEPLGQLRIQSHAVTGVPAVVTYDAPYLLRAPGAKAGAWDDLCRARALALALAHRGGAAPANT